MTCYYFCNLIVYHNCAFDHLIDPSNEPIRLYLPESYASLNQLKMKNNFVLDRMMMSCPHSLFSFCTFYSLLEQNGISLTIIVFKCIYIFIFLYKNIYYKEPQLQKNRLFYFVQQLSHFTGHIGECYLAFRRLDLLLND